MNDMNRPNEKDIKGRSAEYQWHTFADPNATAQDKPLIIESGKDVLAYDIDENKYIDGQGGLWNVNVGHGRIEEFRLFA